MRTGMRGCLEAPENTRAARGSTTWRVTMTTAAVDALIASSPIPAAPRPRPPRPGPRRLARPAGELTGQSLIKGVVFLRLFFFYRPPGD